MYNYKVTFSDSKTGFRWVETYETYEEAQSEAEQWTRDENGEKYVGRSARMKEVVCN